MSNNDKCEAVKIATTLSGQLMTATLTMITGGVGYFVYVLRYREVRWFFYILLFISFLFFVFSIVMSGKGIAASYKEGFNGEWSLEAGKDKFLTQASTCFIGILLFICSVFTSGDLKDDKVKTYSKMYTDKLAEIDKKIESISQSVKIENITLREKIDNISQGVNTGIPKLRNEMENKTKSLEVIIN